MRASWKGSISFGLVYIPVSLVPATRDVDIGFKMLHKECKHRIEYRKYCPVCNREVKPDEIVKGFEYEEDRYVIMEEEDFEKIKTDVGKAIEILHFVNLDEIDPIYYEKSYYVSPSGGDKAFELLKRAMQNEKKIAIAKAIIGTKENLVTIRENKNNLILETMYFHNEVKAMPAATGAVDIHEKELKMAQTLINNMTEPFNPEAYRNEYQERLKEAIEDKINGKEIVVSNKEEKGNVIDLMEALQASLKATEESKQKPAKRKRKSS